MVDAISVARGYEAALGAALGDDLEAPLDEAAQAHWSLIAADGADPALPPGVEPLAGRATAPPALARRLAQVGVVARGDGKRLSRLLEVGQRLVSLEGDLWRWDGFVAAADAPTPAARRLAEKNRLGDLTREAEAARQAVELVRAEAERAAAALSEAAASEAEGRRRAREARAASDRARARAGRIRTQAHPDADPPLRGRGSGLPRQGRARRSGRAQGFGRRGAGGAPPERRSFARARTRPHRRYGARAANSPRRWPPCRR